MIVTSESIILNSRKYGDTSKIITLYSMDYGKISVIAKGARMPKNKFGSSLEPLSCTSATFYLRPNTELYLLSKSELSRKWIRIYNSIEHLSTGFAVIETISITQLNKNPNPELYSLLYDTIDFINELHDNPKSVVVWFFCRFAEIMGFGLDLNFKGTNTSEVFTVSIDNGMIIGLNNIANNRIFKLNSELLEKLSDINAVDIVKSTDYKLEKIEFATLNNFFSSYFSYHFDHKFVLKSGNLF